MKRAWKEMDKVALWTNYTLNNIYVNKRIISMFCQPGDTTPLQGVKTYVGRVMAFVPGLGYAIRYNDNKILFETDTEVLLDREVDKLGQYVRKYPIVTA
jgi:hypothetical protein